MHELGRDPANFMLNQFCEFGNHLVHRTCTGRALEHVFEPLAQRPRRMRGSPPSSRATGSAGTIAAGDRLKEKLGAKIVAVEALECPTMLENGFGEHNIQGIGDKHIPLIHNVMNTDVVAAVSDQATDTLFVLFNTAAGPRYLDRALRPRRRPDRARWHISASPPSATCSPRSRPRSTTTSARTTW